MNIKSMIVNEYTVGGSLLLVGAGFFSTRFTDALSYELFSMPSQIPVIVLLSCLERFAQLHHAFQ